MGNRIAILREGVLQQIDTPRRIFEHPVNAFVAGFIGSPAMNLLRLTVSTEGGETMLVSAGLRLPAPARHARVLAAYRDREVIVGLRPDALTDRRPDAPNVAEVPATVEVVELLGSEGFLYADAGSQDVIARVSPSFDPRPGDAVRLWANVDAMHLFDPDTEASVLEGAPVATA